MSHFVTLSTFDNAIEAHIVKELLGSEQIKTQLIGEHFFGLQTLLNVGLAHIRMQVPAEQLIDAKQVLADYQNGAFEQPLIDEFDLKPLTCASCGNTEIVEVSARPSQLIEGILQIFFIGMVMPANKYKVCKQCKCRVDES